MCHDCFYGGVRPLIVYSSRAIQKTKGGRLELGRGRYQRVLCFRVEGLQESKHRL